MSRKKGGPRKGHGKNTRKNNTATNRESTLLHRITNDPRVLSNERSKERFDYFAELLKLKVKRGREIHRYNLSVDHSDEQEDAIWFLENPEKKHRYKPASESCRVPVIVRRAGNTTATAEVPLAEVEYKRAQIRGGDSPFSDAELKRAFDSAVNFHRMYFLWVPKMVSV